MKNDSMLLFINAILYLIIHNLKLRRLASDSLRHAVNAIFGGFLVLSILIAFRSAAWKNIFFKYIDIALITLILIIVPFQLVKNYKGIICLLRNTFKKKFNIVETLLLTVLLLAHFVFNSMFLVVFFVFMGFLVKEMYIASDFKNKYWL